MASSSYDRLVMIRYGNLTFRRWEKRWVLLFVSTNIWIDQLISAFFERGRNALQTASDGVISVQAYEWKGISVGKYIDDLIGLELIKLGIDNSINLLDLIVLILLVITIFFWIKIAISLTFVYADYQCARMDGERRQYFIVVAILVNFVAYYFLNQAFEFL